MYRIREVAQILGFTERAVRQWVMDRKIKAVKIMSEWRIPEEEVERLKRGEEKEEQWSITLSKTNLSY